ncbi:hypothetical protein FRC20_005274 [Serendipita sp. 405]|nr:hypothetical protein FRC20_005274 [Serendipita sp. 405]
MTLQSLPHGLLLLRAIILASILSTSHAFNKPQVRVTTTSADFHARIMDQWGPGGGKFVKISSDSHHPFQGRTFGGAKRKEIRGSRAFGSGYPYGVDNPSTVAGRPFPFGTWPLWWDQNFMGSGEYGPHLDAIRPGGMLAFVPLGTTTAHFNVTDTEVYYAIADKESLSLLMISYVTWCHVVPAWPSKFDPTLSNSTIRLENVIQYFRASSFAIASSKYNNTFARSPSPNLTEHTPLPTSIEYSAFRKCIDNVTFNALPILNKPPAPTPMDRFIMALIYAGVPILLACAYISGVIVFIFYEIAGYIHNKVLQKLWVRQQLRKQRKAEREAHARARVAALAYECYP